MVFPYLTGGANIMRLALTLLAAALPALLWQLPAHADESLALHGQATFVEQWAGSFAAPYGGDNSLSPHHVRETFDATLYVGARLWRGAEAWINPELDQGFGLDNTVGVAGFPSGEAYKVGRSQPYLRVPRAFLRQVLNLDGEDSRLPADLNQFAGELGTRRLVLTIGKFAVGDVFDTNRFAHDPRVDFLNWAAIDAGTFDYAADAWGYTYGAAIEGYRDAWSARAGVFDLSDVPNSERLDPTGSQFQMITELEHRHELHGQPGRLLVTAYQSRGRMGLLDDAVRVAEVSGAAADIAAVRSYRSRSGIHLTLEQQLTDDLGVFARMGGAAGNVEAYEFTDIDRTLAAGVSLNGQRWRRADDTVGAIAIINDISAQRQRFLDAGGLGILVGDGRLPHAGAERIVETYYAGRLPGRVTLTLDYQYVKNPAYNRDRGPVSILAARLHAQF